MVKGIYDSSCVPRNFEFVELWDNLIWTTGNKYELIQHHCCYDLRKLNFTKKVISIWNSLSDYMVSTNTINILKHRDEK